MSQKITLDGEEYDAGLAYALLSGAERREAGRTIEREAARRKVSLPNDKRVLAVACASQMLGRAPSEMLDDVCEASERGWAGALGENRITVIDVYERLHQGRNFRSVPGLRSDHLQVQEAELARGLPPHRVAARLYEYNHRQREAPLSTVHAERPQVYLLREDLPANVPVSHTATMSQMYAPVIIAGLRAHPVSSAWLFLKRDAVKTYANQLAEWMRAQWPSALEACDDDAGHVADYLLEPKNVMLAAEAFARGFAFDDAAWLLLEDHAGELERFV